MRQAGTSRALCDVVVPPTIERIIEREVVAGRSLGDVGRLLIAQALALIVDLGVLAQPLEVLTAVVGTEQQLSTGVQTGADVCLGAAAVAAVSSAQLGDQGGVHAFFSHLVIQQGAAEITVKHANSFPEVTFSSPGAARPAMSP